MKKTAYVFVIIVAIVSFGLLGCGGKSKTTEKKSSPKIGIIDADKDYSEKETSLPEPAAEEVVKESSPEPVEETVPDFMEEAEQPEQSDDPGDDMTMSQKNAVAAAKDYLMLTSFSHKGLVDQLSSDAADKYPKEDAEFAVRYLKEHGLVDWNEQAVKAAQEYLELTSFSREGLIDQLTSEYGSQFTREQAEYAADQVGY